MLSYHVHVYHTCILWIINCWNYCSFFELLTGVFSPMCFKWPIYHATFLAILQAVLLYLVPRHASADMGWHLQVLSMDCGDTYWCRWYLLVYFTWHDAVSEAIALEFSSARHVLFCWHYGDLKFIIIFFFYFCHAASCHRPCLGQMRPSCNVGCNKGLNFTHQYIVHLWHVNVL